MYPRILLDHTKYVLCKGLKSYNAICSLVLRRGFLIRCAILVIILLIILTGYDNNTFPGTCHPSHWSPLSSSCPQCGCTQTRWQGCQRSASGASGTTPGVGTFVNEREYLELFIIVDDTKPQQGQENLILSFLDLADINSYKYWSI